MTEDHKAVAEQLAQQARTRLDSTNPEKTLAIVGLAILSALIALVEATEQRYNETPTYEEPTT